MEMNEKEKINNKIKGAHVVFYKSLYVGERCNNETGKKEKDFVQAVLLCKRTQDAPIHPGYWALFGGNIEEEPEDGVFREVKEELRICIIIEDMESLCEIEIKREKKSWIKYFAYQLNNDMDTLQLRKNKEGKVEGEGLGWFTAEESHHLVMRPEDRIAVAKFFQKYGI